MNSTKRSRCITQDSCLTQNSTTELINKPPPGWLGVRHLQVFLLFMCLMFAYIIRVNISVAIVSITRDQTDVDEGNGRIYGWSTSTKSIILSAFFWGYLVMNLPASVIGHKVNNKQLLGWSFAMASLLSIVTPPLLTLAPDYSAVIMVVIRVCQGLSQSFMMPMIHGLLSRWGPPMERARFATLILGGLNFGSMLVMACSGLLASSPWGWPSIFYFSGGLGLVWVMLWMLLGGNGPESHSFISDEERDYILKSLPGTAHEDVSSKMSIPWKSIWTSGPVWALILAHMGQNWGIWTILTEIPTYFSEALNVNLKNNGLLTAFPFFLMWIISFPFSYIADQMVIRGYTSVNVSRKFWNSVAHWGGAAALLGMAFAENTSLALTLYTISVTINCCIYMGFNVNHLDLSPNFARILMGISNGSANITAIIAPLFVGAVIDDESKVENWRIVFICSALAFFLANTVFLTLGSGELQWWNDSDSVVPPSDPESNSQHRTQHSSPKEEKI